MWVGLIRSDGFYCVQIEGQLSEYQKLVGGYIETVSTKVRGILLLIDEEGKLKGLPMNDLATICSVVYAPDYIVGDAVLVRLNADCDDWEGWKTRDDCRMAFCQAFLAGAR